MMSVSTLALFAAPRQSVHDSQRQLVDAQTELSTGRHADVGLTLGSRTANAISLRSGLGQNQSIIDMNGLTSTELGLSQTSLSSLTELAHRFSATLIGARNSASGQEVVKGEAKSALESLRSILNADHNGKYIFAGINSDLAPLDDYFSSPATPGKAAVDGAFLAEFGFTQSSPGVGSITPAQMDAFLNGNFDNLFSPASWSATFSSASSQNRHARIDAGYTLEVSANANESAFRELAKAFTMALDLGSGSLNQAAFEKMVDKAVAVSSMAAQQLGIIAGRLGTAQKATADATLQLQKRNDILNREIVSLEGVDQYEVSTRINSLTTQLEASYSITARISKLSLMNYI
jgi:flagellar hook-associated protein 3 FlgL